MKIKKIEDSNNIISENILRRLEDHNNNFSPKVNYQPICFVAEDKDEFMGGVDGYKAWDMFEITNIIVTDKGQGIGTKLINEVEKYCIKSKLTKITAWTLDFQAPAFYERCGFTKFATVPEMAGEHSCHYFIKRI